MGIQRRELLGYRFLLSFNLHLCPYRFTRKMQIPLIRLMIANIAIDHPFPIWLISIGEIKGVHPAEIHRRKLAALMTEAECF